jgi:rod shape-determining protein MreD
MLDGITALEPTHVFSLGAVGFFTARLQKQRYVQEDFVSVALIVFGMVLLSETITALQFCLPHAQDYAIPLLQNHLDLSVETTPRSLGEIWTYFQRIALSSAILSSLWAPVVYYPLNRWWEHVRSVLSPI